jgi:glutamine amidotransferase
MKKPALRSFFHAGSGALVSQAITFVCIPVLFRHYSPKDFGVWALTAAIVVALGSLATLRYELAIVLERERDRASTAFWLTTLIGLAVGVLTVTCLFGIYLFFGEQWKLYINYPPYVIGIWLLFVVSGQALQSWLLHGGDFGAYARAQIGAAVTSNCIFLAGVLQDGDDKWLVAGSMAGAVASLAISLWQVKKVPPLALSICRPNLVSMARFHYKFPVFSLPYTLFSVMRERLPIMLLGTLVTQTQLGWYSQAIRLTSIPVGLSSSAVRPVLFHAGASDGLKAQEQSVEKLLLFIAIMGAPWVGILFYAPGNIVATLLGEQWREAGPLILATSIPALFFAMSNWMDRFFDLSGKQYVNLVTEFITASFSIAVLIWVFTYSHDLLSATRAQSAVLSICYFCVILAAFRIAGFKYYVLLKVIISLVLVVIMFLLIMLALTQILSHDIASWIAIASASLFCIWYFGKFIRNWENPELIPLTRIPAPVTINENAIVIVDYGVGNLGALSNMFDFLGYDSEISSDPQRIASANKVVLPGVGSFDHAMANLDRSGLIPALECAVIDRKVPVLGVCLGMQLLGKGSEEGSLKGLGWIAATSKKITPEAAANLKVPHMGWSEFVAVRANPLFTHVPTDARFYFAHSFHVVCERTEDITGVVDYGGLICCAINSANIFGVQFHPEKSHRFGLAMLKAFAEFK